MTTYSHILACLDVLGCPGHIRWSLCCKPPRFLRSFLNSRLRKFQGMLGFSSSSLLTLCCFSRMRRVLLLLPLFLPPQALLALSHLLSVCLFSLGSFPFLQFLSFLFLSLFLLDSVIPLIHNRNGCVLILHTC
jgi:hypothetical protein